MDKNELQALLEDSEDNDAWVEALAAFFDAHAVFFGHGTDNPRDEAYWLLRHLQGWDDTPWETPARAQLAAPAAQLAQARVTTRRPLAYLIEEAWFCGLKFFVDDRVLVPRSPMAELIEQQFAPWVTLRDGDRLLDIGTGSGCIAIAAAHYCPAVSVDATDASDAALEVAERNRVLHGMQDRVSLHAADLYPRSQARYRVIMSNPPYVPEAQHATLPPEYLHEPRMGLVGGPTGLEPVWPILRGAQQRLCDDGIVVVEVGNEAEQFDAAVPGLDVVWMQFEHGGEGVFVVQAAQLREYLTEEKLPDER